jgi:pantothenate kinase
MQEFGSFRAIQLHTLVWGGGESYIIDWSIVRYLVDICLVSEPPPIVVAIVGPPKVGKSTLLRCLVKNFTRQTLTNIQV